MKIFTNKDQHDNSAVKANETALSSSGGGGGRQSGRQRGIGIPSNNRMPKKDRLPPKEYWKLIKMQFLQYLACFLTEDIEGIRDYENCLKYYNKIKKSMPSVPFFCAVVEHLSKNVWKGYPPSLMKFLENKDWLSISDSVKTGIESNMAYWEIKSQKKIAKFNGVSYKAQSNNMQQKPQEEPPPISDKVPPAEEIESMTTVEQTNLAVENGYGLPVSIFIDAVRRRDQLRNEQEVI